MACMNWKKAAPGIWLAVYWVLALLYWEGLLHMAVFGSFGEEYLYAVGFSASVGLALALAVSFLKKGRFAVNIVLTLILSVLWNFTLNRKFTFKSAANVPIAMLKVAGFYAVFTPLSTWWTALLTEPAYGIMWNEYLVLILTMLVNFVTEYLFDRFVVFGSSLDTAEKH